MSVQFGRCTLNGQPLDRGYFERVKPLLVPYGPNDSGFYSNGNIGVIYCALHTTKESRRERQPCFTAGEAVITWDGRLDNRTDLIRQLGHSVTSETPDVAIVAAAWELWRNNCFGKLIGDWAMSIWEPRTRSLIFARDPIGIRHLYYSLELNQVTWSTVLDPLVLLADKKFSLCEEYIAGWFSHFPANHVTPYVGILSVPPSCAIHIRDGSSSLHKYWDFDPGKRIHYRTDSEYEDHFRTVFAQAVRRRLRSDTPILAELSGGMDSSSIVCVADALIAHGDAETAGLDTISYYNDLEPNWNERPYFAKVEEKRGRIGFHLDLSNQERFNFDVDYRFAPFPGSGGSPTTEDNQFSACLTSNGNHVVLSGIGGDEVMGGVPTPLPELQDLLTTGQFGTLAHKLKIWALNKRVPWFRLLFATAGCFLPVNPFGTQKEDGPEAWFDARFFRRNRAALQGLRSRIKLSGTLPSFQGNFSNLLRLQGTLACEALPTEPAYEKRYPFLDRDLLEFMFAIPREQLVRPGRRRSLMRRSLESFVPSEILERKRKAYVSRGPVVALQAARGRIEALLADPLTVRYGLMDPVRLDVFRDRILSGSDLSQWALLVRTIFLERWLRSQSDHLRAAEPAEDQRTFAIAEYLPHEKSPHPQATKKFMPASHGRTGSEQAKPVSDLACAEIRMKEGTNLCVIRNH